MNLDELKQRIELRQGDIADVEADAIVNAANTDLILGAGVSGAIGRKAGPIIQEECDRIASVSLGEAVATQAGDLNARYIIHAATIELGHFAAERDIARATRSALRCAEELGLRTVAFPAIGTGAAAFPVDRCAQVMLAAVARHLTRAKAVERVIFVLFGEDKMGAFREAYERLELPRKSSKSRSSRSRRRRSGSGGRGDGPPEPKRENPS